MSEQNQKQPDNSIKTGHDQHQHPPSAQKPGLRDLGQSIIESLRPGVVAFDRQLRIIQANSQAGRLIDLGEYIDQSLAKGTDPNVWGNWTQSLKSAITTGQKSDFKAVRYNFDAKKRLLHIVCTPLKQGRTQKVIGGTVVIEDVTEKVDIEHQLAQAERFAAIGKVAGKVAHELNNPMDGILRYINLAIRVIDGGNPEKAAEYLQQCRSGLMRMIQVIGELLEFSRSTYPPFEHTPIDQIIEDAVRAMESAAKRMNIEVIRDCPDDMPRFRGTGLFQVFCNLIKNAADAMQGAGRLKITMRRSDNFLEVQFHDTGPGFEHQNAEAIFEPFFTTKTHGRGTGLGLAICKDIVEKYNGKITARNAPDHGSIFTVLLPLTQENSPQSD
jgi:signal transduction histidine kinase